MWAPGDDLVMRPEGAHQVPFLVVCVCLRVSLWVDVLCGTVWECLLVCLYQRAYLCEDMCLCLVCVYVLWVCVCFSVCLGLCVSVSMWTPRSVHRCALRVAEEMIGGGRGRALRPCIPLLVASLFLPSPLGWQNPCQLLSAALNICCYLAVARARLSDSLGRVCDVAGSIWLPPSPSGVLGSTAS